MRIFYVEGQMLNDKPILFYISYDILCKVFLNFPHLSHQQHKHNERLKKNEKNPSAYMSSSIWKVYNVKKQRSKYFKSKSFRNKLYWDKMQECCIFDEYAKTFSLSIPKYT